jgi:predicted dehydrogenase
MTKILKFRDLQIDKLLALEQEVIDQSDRPELNNKVRKLIFFLFREGIVRTLNKIKSKRSKEVQPSKRKTLIFVSVDEKIFVNFSTQTTDQSEFFIIKNQFFKVEKTFSIKDVKDETIFNQFDEKDSPAFNNKPSVALITKQDTNFLPDDPEKLYKGIFIYGLGDYARVYIAPNIKNETKIYCVDYSYPLTTCYQKKYGYKNFGIIPEDSYTQLQNTESPLAIIATYHSDHTRIANEIFNLNPNTLIFIEKPPCVTLDDLKSLTALYDKGAKIEIGYNRRFIPLNQKLRELYFKEQKVISISIKEILINKSHWYLWNNQGTRITGNLTHWIDLCTFWIDGVPVEINLLNSGEDSLAISILYSEGSLVNLIVSDKGNSLRGVQEHIEIRTENETCVINDYNSFVRILKNGKKTTQRFSRRIKGHDAMYKHLIRVYSGNSDVKYTRRDLEVTSLTTKYIADMYLQGIKNLNVDRKMTI